MLESEFSKPNLRRILLSSFLWQCFLLSLPVLSSPTKHQPVTPIQTQPNLCNFHIQNFKIKPKNWNNNFFTFAENFFLARMKARWVEGGRTIQQVSHALVNRGSVQICLDFNWTPFHTVMGLAIHILSSDLCKMQLALDLQEYNYWGADKSLVWPGRKQAQKHVRDTCDFNKIKMQAVIKFLFLRGKALKEIHAILTETLTCFLPDRVKDLSTPLYNITQEVSVYFNYVSMYSRCRWVY